MTDPWEALADPIRRRIVELLAAGERTAGELAEEFEVSRPAVSRHLRVLRESGLVTATAVDRRRVYRLQGDVLDDALAWVEQVRAFWSQRFDALDTEIARGARDRRRAVAAASTTPVAPIRAATPPPGPATPAGRRKDTA